MVQNTSITVVINLTIGTKVMLVNKAYSHQNKPGGKILSARVSSFWNNGGKVEPMFKIPNYKEEVSLSTFDVFIDQEEALKAICSDGK